MKSAKTKKKVGSIIIYVIKIIVAIIMFFPIIWIFSGGFKTLTEFTTSCNFIPKNFTLENYAYIFLHSNLLLYVRNTVLLMLGTTAGTLISSSLVAYPLARMDFKGKKVIFSIIIATMMIPNIALIIPQYIRIMYFCSGSISGRFQKNWMSRLPLMDAQKHRFILKY